MDHLFKKTRLKTPFYVIIQHGEGTPLAWKVYPHALFKAIYSLICLMLAGFIGTLLLFREIEINRKLRDKALSYQLLAELALKRHEPLPKNEKGESPPTTVPMVSKDTLTTQFIPHLSIPPHITVPFRIIDFNAIPTPHGWECEITMAPTSHQVSEGEMLAVLELEVPRIGLSSSGMETRKRFVIYPSNITVERVDENMIREAAKRKFKFSRALQIKIPFQVTKIYRPNYVHFFFFNPQGLPMAQEKKAIKLED